MAYYNPQRVVFNPNSMVIQNAGALGGAISDALKEYNAAQEKRYKEQREFEQRQNELDFNQAMQNNQLLQKEREFDYNTQRDSIKDKQWQMDYNQKANQYALQNALKQQEINTKNKEDEILASQAMLSLPNYTSSNPDINAIKERFNTIKEAGGNSYYHGQGLLGGTMQNIKGIFGGENINDAQDNLFKFMSDSIYNEKVRRDTTYNRKRHDEIYKEPSALKPQTVNAKNFETLTRDFISVNEAKINAYYDEQKAKVSNLKNPYINALYEEQRKKDLKDFREGLAKELEYYYIKGEPLKSEITDISQGMQNQDLKLHVDSISKEFAKGNIVPLNDGTFAVYKNGKYYQLTQDELQ